LTKAFEEVRRGTVEELTAYYATGAPRGEVVLIVAGRPEDAPPAAEDLSARAASLLASGATPRDVARTLVAEFGVARNEAYRLAQLAGPTE
jgi:16S rRNA (cytidine1402-2'-O)-methyltransferase